MLHATKETELACGWYVTNGATRLVCKHSLTDPGAAIGLTIIVAWYLQYRLLSFFDKQFKFT